MEHPAPTGSTSKPTKRPTDLPGLRVQRGDRDNQRKAIILATPPPPPPRRARARGTTRSRPPDPVISRRYKPPTLADRPVYPTVRCFTTAETPRPPPATPAANRPPPPTQPERPPSGATSAAPTPAAPSHGRPASAGRRIPVSIGPGCTILVPHSAIHHRRYYKAHTPTGTWVIRFNGAGQPRSVRRTPSKGGE